MADPTWRPPGDDSPGESTGPDDLTHRYDLGAPLGRGGMGEVFVARDVRLEREVALKTLVSHAPTDKELQRFLLEARVTGLLDHPHVPPVYDLGTGPDGAFFTMKRLKGQTLTAVIEGGQLSLRQLLQVFLKVCDAVAYAHDRGVLHRDLKPDNVMVGEFGQVYVLDWGLAKVIGGLDPLDLATADTDDAGLTARGAVIGTPAYMAPEQADGDPEAIDERSDVYGLGSILYAILTRWPPRDGPARDVVAALKARSPHVPPSRRCKVPRELEAITQRALAAAAGDRYPSVVELRDDLERYLEGREVQAMRYSALERLMKWGGRHRRPLTALGIGGGIIGAVLVTAVIVSLMAIVSSATLTLNAQRESAALTEASEARTRQALAETRASLAMAHLEAGRPALARDLLEVAQEEGTEHFATTLAEAELARRFAPAELAWRVESSFAHHALSPDGTRALISERGEASVREVPSGDLLLKVENLKTLVAAGWSPKGARVVRQLPDRWQVVDLASRDVLAEWPGPPGSIEGVRAYLVDDGDLAIVSGAEIPTSMIRVSTGALPVRLGPTAIEAVADDGSVLLGGPSAGPHRSSGRRLVWDTATGDVLAQLPTQGDPAVSADGSAVALLLPDRLQVFEIPGGRLRFERPVSVGGGRLQFLADDARIVVAGGNNHLLVFDAYTGALLRDTPIVDGPTTSVGTLSAARSADVVLAVSTQVAQVWSVPPPTPAPPPGALARTALEPLSDGQLVLTTTLAGGLEVVDWRSGLVLETLPTTDQGTRDVRWIGEGRVVTADRDGAARLFDLRTGQLVHRLVVGPDRICGSALGWRDQVIVGLDNGDLLRFDAARGEELGRFRGDLGTIWDLELASDDLHLAATGRGHTDPPLQVFDLETGAVVFTMDSQWAAFRAAFSPDGDRVVAAGSLGAVQVARWRNGTQRRPFEGLLRQMVQSVQWSPDGSKLILGEYDGRLDWIDDATGSRYTVAHAGASVLDLGWVPDRQVLLSVSSDGVLRQLDLERATTWKRIARTLQMDEDPGPAGGRRWLDLARGAALRGDWGLARSRLLQAEAGGATPDPMDVARAAALSGDATLLQRALTDAEAGGTLLPSTLAVWRRYAARTYPD